VSNGLHASSTLTYSIDGLSKVYTVASDAYANGIAESECADTIFRLTGIRVTGC
jgi:hypothetical protein